MRSKKLLIGLLVTFFLAGALVAGGSLVAERVARKKVDSLFASVSRALPPGSRLTYGAFGLELFSLSAALDDVRLYDPRRGLDVHIDRLRAGSPRFQGRSLQAVDLDFQGVRGTLSGGEGRTDRTVTLSLDRLDLEKVGLPALMDLARNRTSATPAALLRGLETGRISLENLQAGLGDGPGGGASTTASGREGGRPAGVAGAVDEGEKPVSLSLARLTLGDIRKGRLGALQVRGLAVARGSVDLAVNAVSLAGLDLGRAVDWFDRTGGHLYREARLDVDFFGLGTLSVEDIRLRLDGKPVVIGRFFMDDLDSTSSFPTRMTLGVERLVLPWALVPDDVANSAVGTFLKQHRLTGLEMNLEWRHALDEDRRIFLFGPMTADLGPLGLFRGRLDLSNVDRTTLSELAEHQERFINSLRIRGALLELEAGASTTAFLDFALEQGKTSRAELIQRFEAGEDIGRSAILVLGDQRGGQLAGALRRFLQVPARFRFSADAGDGAMDLDTLVLTMSMSAADLARAYNVETTYESVRQ